MKLGSQRDERLRQQIRENRFRDFTDKRYSIITLYAVLNYVN